MNKFQIFSIVSIFIVSCATVSVQASNVILDTTIINFSASGSPNTISGSWDTSPLIVSDGAMIDYFTVELTEMNSDFGKPESISFGSYLPGNSRSINFSWNTYTSVADTVIGDIGVINSGSTILHAWDFMNRLVANSQIFWLENPRIVTPEYPALSRKKIV